MQQKILNNSKQLDRQLIKLKVNVNVFTETYLRSRIFIGFNLNCFGLVQPASFFIYFKKNF